MNIDNYISEFWGQDTSEHHNLFYRLCLQAPKKNFLELGIRDGISSAIFAYAAREAGGMAYGIDIHDCPGAVKHISDLNLSSYWKPVFNDDRNRDDCLRTLGLSPDTKFGLIFFDSSKVPEHTALELELYSPLVCNGGFMLFHDVYMGGHWQPEIAKPIEDFLEKNDKFVKYATYRNCHGLLIAQKMEE